MAAVGLAFGIGELKAGWAGTNFIGKSTFTEPQSDAKIKMVADLRIGYWLALGAGAVLFVLAVLRRLFVGKSMAFVQNMLREFRILGIKTALDDFGTGYSSLSYLEHLPFDKLKIDRAFVHNAQEGTKNTELLKGIINLAHGLGMIVVAEGAETQVELDMLRKLKADFVQGYVIAKPMPAEQATIAADLHDQNQEHIQLIA